MGSATRQDGGAETGAGARRTRLGGNGLSLAAWLATAVASPLVVLTVALSFAAYAFGRGEIEDSTRRTLDVVAEDRHEALVHTLMRTRTRAEQLLATLEARCAAGDTSCRRLLLENFVRINEALAARLVESTDPPEDGTVIEIGPAPLVADLESLPALQPPQLAQVRTVADTRYLAVSADNGGGDLAILFGHAYADPLFASRFGLGEAGETFLTDAQGFFVTPGRYPSSKGYGSHPIDARPMIACLRGEGATMVAPDYRGAWVIHGFRPVPEIGGGCIMAHIDHAEALAPIRAFGRTLAAITAGGLLLVALVSVLVARRLNAPLARLAARAEALAAGDLDSPVPVEGPAELRAYARAFGEMACSLRGRLTELDEARRELDAFNASVTHDLRAPLRAVAGFTARVLEDAADVLPPSSADMLRRVLAASRRMERLVEDLLALSRVSRADLLRVRVDLSQLAQVVAAELPRDPARTVALDVSPGLEAKGDPGLLHILLANLLGNAWKFTATTPEPRIEVFATVRDGERVFAVRDNGVGFDPAFADRLFKPFSRLHSGRDFEGTGIGLTTVARIVRRHGGRVWAEGAVGGGATVYFTLPNEGRAA